MSNQHTPGPWNVIKALFIGGILDGDIKDDSSRHGYYRHEIKTPHTWVIYVHYSLDLDQAMMKLIAGYRPNKPTNQNEQ